MTNLFQNGFNEFGKQCHAAAKAKGFYAEPPTNTQYQAAVTFLGKLLQAAEEFEAERKRKVSSMEHVDYCNSDVDLAIVKTALLASEVAEAAEWALSGNLGDETETHEILENGNRVPKFCPKPEGYASELADVVIRLADQVGLHNVDLDKEIARKLDFNAQRPFKHGKSF
jgi:NTP pyrophosphatase (non-canonical NTP hydrolase)